MKTWRWWKRAEVQPETGASVSEVLLGVLMMEGAVAMSYEGDCLTMTLTAEDGTRHSQSMSLVQWCEGVNSHPKDGPLRFLLRGFYRPPPEQTSP